MDDAERRHLERQLLDLDEEIANLERRLERSRTERAEVAARLEDGGS